MGEYIKGEYTVEKDDGSGETVNLLADSRTFLYKDVLLSAQKNDYWLMGRTPARGNDTEAWAAQAKVSGRNERFANETGILNILTWTGAIFG